MGELPSRQAPSLRRLSVSKGNIKHSFFFSPSLSCSGLSFLFFIIILLFRWLGDGRGLPSSSLMEKNGGKS